MYCTRLVFAGVHRIHVQPWRLRVESKKKYIVKFLVTARDPWNAFFDRNEGAHTHVRDGLKKKRSDVLFPFDPDHRSKPFNSHGTPYFLSLGVGIVHEFPHIDIRNTHILLFYSLSDVINEVRGGRTQLLGTCKRSLQFLLEFEKLAQFYYILCLKNINYHKDNILPSCLQCDLWLQNYRLLVLI